MVMVGFPILFLVCLLWPGIWLLMVAVAGCGGGRRTVRYPCGGAISVRFSAAKALVVVRYSHHAVHAAPGEL